MKTKIPRRDLCYVVADRMARLSHRQSVLAWAALGRGLDALKDKDIPKFKDLMAAIRAAIREAKR